jgi:hypothetical protein
MLDAVKFENNYIENRKYMIQAGTFGTGCIEIDEYGWYKNIDARLMRAVRRAR